MIAVRVTVRNDEVARAVFSEETVDRRDEIDLARARIQQQRALTPEDQIEKRLHGNDTPTAHS